MFTKKLLVSALLAAGMLGAAAIPVTPVAAADIIVRTAPPEPRYERTPAPRRGYVWSPGYHRWNGKRYVWVAGSWQRDRPGYAYRAPGWVERDGRWHYQPSRWDRDGDGIPNRRDATPDGRRDRDRDNDGIPNRQDPTPDGRRSDRDRDGVPDRADNYPNTPKYR